jgi:uncharacterized protein with ACT and thioredoxin-like domain
VSKQWRIVPTSRRTSKSDRVDILDGAGRYVAGYVHRADALRMIHDPAQIADEAIGLFLEFRDQHGHDEVNARVMAVGEVVEGCAFDEEAFYRERAAEPSTAGTADDLPF